MIYFLASDPLLYELKAINPANRFLDNLRKYIKKDSRALFICSDPKAYDFTDQYAKDMQESFEKAGFRFTDYCILDGRNKESADELVANADLILLAGGHVPTQNQFFQDIHLKELLNSNDKIVIGSSAGSMNSARLVYAQPEEDGEAVSETYQRFLKGLDLTQTMILPHYQAVKNAELDGLRLFEDITYPDSEGHDFYALPDGSYLLGNGRAETIFGQAYRIKDGRLTKLSDDNQTYCIKGD